MAKELPYFKFEPSEWENGLIQMCSRESKGLFIDIISIYWQRLGDLPYRYVLQKLCNGNADALKELTDENILKIYNGNIVIHFLDEQLKEFNLKSKQASDAAKARWEKHNENGTLDADAMQKHSEGNAIREEKRREEKNNNAPNGAIVFNFDAYLETLNKVFDREFRVVNSKIRSKIKARLKEGYTKQDIANAIYNCKDSEYHKENNYQYCTAEYFSRSDTLDKFSNLKEVKKQKIQL